jgi:hypothetical protein
MRVLLRIVLVAGLAVGLAFVGVEIWVVVELAQHAAPAPLGGS